MALQQTLAVVFSVFSVCFIAAESKAFLHSSHHGRLNASAFQREVQLAMDEVQGCGGHIGKDKLDEIEQRLMPIWRSLPKNGRGRIERSLLRHLVHRYFMQKSSILIRGFEESRPGKESEWGSADILSQRVPGYVESVLLSRHADENGFDLKDAVSTIAMLEELIFESEASVLEQAFLDSGLAQDKELVQSEMETVLRSYLIRWMLTSEGADLVEKVLRRPEKMHRIMPHWQEIMDFANGQAKTFDFSRQHDFVAGKNPLRGYTITDAHQIVGSITTSFASFWESQCDAMKMKLVSLDSHHTGRVPLSLFHSDEYKDNFAESTEYLRQLGALDETSRWSGPQVIIPNYIQGANNCLVSAPHYLVCCVNFCEGIHGDIERAIGAPVATSSQILGLVANMSEQTTVDHDHYANTQGALASQLEQIAAAHGGKVPLHGRLFAQWLHYVFPRECPFPHKAGAVVTSTPLEFGDYLVSETEKAAHVDAMPSETQYVVNKEEAEWMSQWSSDEELIADYTAAMRASWSVRHLATSGAGLLLLAALLGVVGLSGRRTLVGEASPEMCKAHFV